MRLREENRDYFDKISYNDVFCHLRNITNYSEVYVSTFQEIPSFCKKNIFYFFWLTTTYMGATFLVPYYI